ncbi:MAG: glycosyltransferase [Oxalobacteraceae bacterium]|nr:glycosyltransferase [Oxalobacteraceae bacterium]
MNNSRSYPLVSIITPAYNQAEFLVATIQSVLSQSYPNIEYIVLDDGSTDHTQDILKKYDGKIRWESHENMGQAKTLNRGWEMSKGEVLSYLSSDDLLDEHAIRNLMEKYVGDSLIIFGAYRLIDQTGQKIKTKKTIFHGYKDMVHNFNCPIGPGAVFSRDLFLDSGGWNQNFRQIPDYDFWIRAGRHAKFIKIDEEIASFRVHTGSQTFASSTANKSDESIVCINQLFDKSEDLEIKFNKKMSLASAYVYSSCLHFRSGRYIESIERLIQSILYGGYYAFSLRNVTRFFGSFYSIFKYKYIEKNK